MPEKKQSAVSSVLVTDIPELTLDELCISCGITVEQVSAYVEEGIVEPHGPEAGASGGDVSQWRFSQVHLLEIRRAFRLERDLGINPAGIALAFELMNEIDRLKRRLARHEAE